MVSEFLFKSLSHVSPLSSTYKTIKFQIFQMGILGCDGGSEGNKGFCKLMKACWVMPRPPQSTTIINLKGLDFTTEDEDNDQVPNWSFNELPEEILLECLSRLQRSSLKSAMAVCHRWRSILGSEEFYQIRKHRGKIHNNIYVLGCGNTLSRNLGLAVYKKISKRVSVWHTEKSMEPVSSSICNAQGVSMHNKVYLFGGSLGCTLVYNAWTRGVTNCGEGMAVNKRKFASAIIDGKIYVAGGTPGRRESMSDLETFDITAGTWEKLQDMPRRRYACVGASVDRFFYVIGGLTSSCDKNRVGYVPSMDVYDTRSGCWVRPRALPMGGCVITCCVLKKCIYMVCSHAVELSLWRYDTEKETWGRVSPPPPVPSPLRMDSGVRFGCVGVGDCVVLVQVKGSIDDLLRRSGREGKGMKNGLVLVYDTKLHHWSRGDDFPSQACVRGTACCTVVSC